MSHQSDDQRTSSPVLGRLSKKTAGFVLVDFLDGFMPGIQTIDRHVFRKNVEAFVSLGRVFKMPTIQLGEEGGFREKFMEELTRQNDHVIAVERHTPSAWHEPAFVEAVESTGKKQWTLGGISIDICTTLLALDMRRAGYEVFVCPDVSGSDTLLNEQAAMLRLSQAGVGLSGWASIASELLEDWQTPEGPEVGRLYSELSRRGNKV